jgi:ribonuclease HI
MREKDDLKVIKLYTDGAARGNPGPAGIGVVIMDPDGTILEEWSEPLGTATNNVAEYSALLKGLEIAEKHRPERLLIHSDSELMVKQLAGVYKVKAEHLMEYYQEALTRLSRFPSKQVIHVPRALNSRADHLAASAADGKKPKSR